MSATLRTQSIFNDLVKQNYGHASIEVAIKEVEQLEIELAEALDEIKGLRQLVNDCHIVAGQLETERNEARAEIERKDKNLQVIAALANNALYFDDNSDYESTLWNILAAAKPELFAESDMPKLKFMRGDAAERERK